MGEWDDMLKQLIKDHPEDFIALVLPKAQYVTRLPEELRSRRRHTDALCLTILNGQLMLVLFEFQRNNDYNMGERLLQYNVLASMNNDGLPIYSCVIWLRKDGNVIESPYIRRIPDGREAWRLYFESIKLWDMTAEELLEMDMPGLLPLVFLTRDGKRADVVEQTVTKLGATRDSELLLLGYMMGSMVLTEEADRKTLKRRFAMFEDMLRDTWAYKEIMEEGLQQGLRRGVQQGLQQGLQQGELKAMRAMLIHLVQKRFPELVLLAEQRANLINEPSVLQTMVDMLIDVQTAVEVRRILMGEIGQA